MEDHMEDPSRPSRPRHDPSSSNENGPENSMPVLKIQSPLFKNQPSLKKMARLGPGMWHKLDEARNDHEHYLDKLGHVDEADIKAHYNNAAAKGLALAALKSASEFGNSRSTSAVKGVPWKKKDLSNPFQERKKVFENFNRIGGPLPRSPPRLAQQFLNHRKSSTVVLNPPRPATKKKATKSKKKIEKTPIFIHEFVKDAKAAEQNPYAKTTARVDTGLGHSGKPKARFTSPGPSMADKLHQPLTIGPKFPEGFTLPASGAGRNNNYNNSDRASIVANVTARLYPDKHPHLLKETHKILHHADWDYGTTIAPPPLKARPSNTVQLFRSPAKNVVSTMSSDPRVKAYVQSGATTIGANHNQDGVGGQQQKRQYRPSQLLPLHVPGVKYDNIYIGPYSGSESDRDSEDNMDRDVKSRKR